MGEKSARKQHVDRKLKQDQLNLNLQKNSEGVNESRERIQGSYPVYQPPNAVPSEKLIQEAHDCVDITWGSGPHHDLHHMRLLDTSPETFNKEGNLWLFWM